MDVVQKPNFVVVVVVVSLCDRSLPSLQVEEVWKEVDELIRDASADPFRRQAGVIVEEDLSAPTLVSARFRICVAEIMT
jgi:hypothetical protein